MNLADRIGHTFADPELLRLALTHRSWCAENDAPESNERLEFLGDAVLDLVVTRYLYESMPGEPEGELAKIRASVVSSATLAEVGADLGLGAELLLGKGEAASGGAEKPSILADATEAVIGATYLDGGIEVADRFVMALVGDRINDAMQKSARGDFKTSLQETSLRVLSHLPTYDVSHTGPDHAKEFTARVSIDGELFGTGSGPNKKSAEQMAAKQACKKLQQLELQTEVATKDKDEQSA